MYYERLAQFTATMEKQAGDDGVLNEKQLKALDREYQRCVKLMKEDGTSPVTSGIATAAGGTLGGVGGFIGGGALANVLAGQLGAGKKVSDWATVLSALGGGALGAYLLGKAGHGLAYPSKEERKKQLYDSLYEAAADAARYGEELPYGSTDERDID